MEIILAAALWQHALTLIVCNFIMKIELKVFFSNHALTW